MYSTEFAILALDQAAKRENAVEFSAFGFKLVSISDVAHRVHDVSDEGKDVVRASVCKLLGCQSTIKAGRLVIEGLGSGMPQSFK